MFERSAAAHERTELCIAVGIEGAAKLFRFFEDLYLLAGNISVADQVCRAACEAIPEPTK